MKAINGSWKDLLWGDIATLEYGKSLKGYRDRTSGFPVYGTNGPIGFNDTALCNQSGVIIGRKGAYRGVHFAPEPFFVIDTAFYLKPKLDFDIKWAYYQLLTQDINGLDSGSAIPSTSRDDFYGLQVKVPPPDEQRAIASILGALDDKIELNRRMNAALESLARAIFKSWFVDFDPVHSKSGQRTVPLNELSPFTLPPSVSALFPAAFQDSDLGKIPEGWKAMPISEAIEVNPKRILKKGTIAKYLDMKNMPIEGHRPNQIIDREMKSGSKFVNGDTLMARITPCLENGKTAFVDFLDSDDEVAWGSTEYIVLRPKPPLPEEYGYFLARDEEVRLHAIQNMTGSSGRQRVQIDSFDSFLIAVPDEPIAQAFAELVKPLMSKIKSASESSLTLKTLRDTLLPRLLSGELSVRDFIIDGVAK